MQGWGGYKACRRGGYSGGRSAWPIGSKLRYYKPYRLDVQVGREEEREGWCRWRKDDAADLKL